MIYLILNFESFYLIIEQKGVNNILRYFLIFILVVWISLFGTILSSYGEIDFYQKEREQAMLKALKEAKQIVSAKEFSGVATRREVEREKFASEQKRPYEELRIEAERAGFERYYVQGEGFKVTDFLGIAASTEIVEEPKRIDDMVLILGQEFENFRGYTEDHLRAMTRPLFTRSIAGQAILRYKDFPRLKYTYEEKDVLIEYINKDVNIWKINEFDLLYGFSLFEKDNFLTLNPIYKRITIVNEDTAFKFENINQYLFQYSLKPLDNFEIFGQQTYETNKNVRNPTPSKNKTRYSRLELRKNFPEQKLGVTLGWYHGETKWMPADTLQVKNELYTELGKDLTYKWKGRIRLEYDIDELQRVSNSHINSDVFRFENKLSYYLTEYLFVSFGMDFSDDLSSINEFDNLKPFIELEYYRYGFLRWVLGYRHTEYLNFDQRLDMIYSKLFLFRF